MADELRMALAEVLRTAGVEQADFLREGMTCSVMLYEGSALSVELPPNVAQAFAKDMRAFFAASSSLKQDEIAARQMHALNEHRRPRYTHNHHRKHHRARRAFLGVGAHRQPG